MPARSGLRRSVFPVGGRKLVDVLPGVNMPPGPFGFVSGQPGVKFFGDQCQGARSCRREHSDSRESPPPPSAGRVGQVVFAACESGGGGDSGWLSFGDVSPLSSSVPACLVAEFAVR
jgi:hypothetical protein